MLAALTREFLVPRRFLVGIPVLLSLWAAVDACSILSLHARFGTFTPPADVYWSLVNDAFAYKYLVGFAAYVILERARVSVLGGTVLLLALTGLSAALLDLVIRPIFGWSAAVLVGGLIGLAASPRGGGLIPFLLLTIGGPVLVAAVLMATAFVATTTALSGKTVRFRSTLAMWATHLAVALIAIIVAVGASAALRSYYDLSTQYGRGVSGFVPLTAALIAFLVIGFAHWAIYRWRMRGSTQDRDASLRVWLCTAIVAAFALFAPYLIAGVWGVRLHMAVVRPVLRQVGILPTPKLEIGSARVELPYREPGIMGATQDGAKEQLTIRAIAHSYRSESHPGEPIDIAIHARKTPVPRYGHDIESDLKKALAQAGADAASEPFTLRYDYSDTRSYRSVARFLPAYPDLYFTTLVRSRDVTFEELETVLDRFIGERVRPSKNPA